jgi:quaternary ammonium compound-resistance protein SugE
MNALTPTPIFAWGMVVVSGTFEVLFSVLLKQTDGFSQPVPSIVAIATALLSIWIMTVALRTLPLGSAYAVWAGIGTLGTAILAIIIYSEPITLAKSAFMLLVIVGIIGLQLQSV